MKLHLCCGDVYLQGYVNVDILGIVDPSLAERTDLKHYYANRRVGHKNPTYVDMIMDVTHIPWEFEDNSFETVVMINGIEHFNLYQAQNIVNEVRRVLIPGGLFLVDFPDIRETVLKYINRDPDFCMRHIYCNHKNEYSIHNWGYTRQTFKDLLGPGWKARFTDIVQHDYPVIGCKAVKCC